MINVNVENETRELNDNTTYYELIKFYETKLEKRPFLVRANGVTKELRRLVRDGETIEFLYYDNDIVKAAYARTAALILFKAIDEVYNKGVDACLRFRLKNAYFFDVGNEDLSDEKIKEINKTYAKLVEESIVIKKVSHTKTEAFKIIEENNMEDVKLLFTYSYRPRINFRYINNYVKYVNGEVLYDTSYIKYYKIEKYHDCLVLILSNSSDEKDIKVLNLGDKLFNTLNDSTNWAKKLGINTVGRLNLHIADNTFDDLVVMTESFQDKQFGDIAEKIKESNKKLIFIAGPSSSGKTSFSHRLMYHLRALDLNPHPIASDNFFKERNETPKDENGEYNFEILDAMDVDLLNKTLNSLLSGKETPMPTFDFVSGKKFYDDKKKLTIGKNDIIILEGIHCLNPNLTPNVNENNIFKIYISALSEVCIDNMNRIATSDLRLIRRIVRDSRTRGTTAKETLKRWKSVRQGEVTSIFPYQENADIIFNSALIYEFGALKDKALPKLFSLSEDKEVGDIARRLIKILNYFLGVETSAIPRYSIIREFIGDSIMEVG